jgi:hypothetical protein
MQNGFIYAVFSQNKKRSAPPGQMPETQRRGG